MARITDNFGYIPVRLGQELARRRAEFAERLETRLREQIASGEGRPKYSIRPTWFNTTRIRSARSRFDEYRRAFPPRRRSRYGTSSIWLEKGYAEYRGIVRGHGPSTGPMNYELTGQLMRAFRARAVPLAKGQGLHAWVAFRRQDRSYGKLTNIELAKALNKRFDFKPFWPTQEMANDIFEEIIGSAVRASGGS